MKSEPVLRQATSGDRVEFSAGGEWTGAHSQALELLVNAAERQVSSYTAIVIDTAGVSAMDTFGAWLLERLTRGAVAGGKHAELVGLPAR